MSSSKPVKVKRYYGLRIVSMIYKMLAVLIVIVILGGEGYLALAAVNSPLSDYVDFSWWLNRSLVLLIAGGLLSFTFFVIAQLVDVQLSISDNLRALVEHVQQQPAKAQTVEIPAPEVKYSFTERQARLLNKQE